MPATRSDVEHPTLTVLTLTVRVSEDGSITQLPERVAAATWTMAPGMGDWQPLAEKRAKAIAAPQIAEAEAQGFLGLARHVESQTFTSRGIWHEAVDQLRDEALQALTAGGVALRRFHSEQPVSVQGQWTVDLAWSGSDHAAVREVFDAEAPGAAAEWAAHPERFPRVDPPKNGRVYGESLLTPEAMRELLERGRRPPRRGGRFRSGSWVTWTESGLPRRDVISEGLSSSRPTEASTCPCSAPAKRGACNDHHRAGVRP